MKNTNTTSSDVKDLIATICFCGDSFECEFDGVTQQVVPAIFPMEAFPYSIGLFIKGFSSPVAVVRGADPFAAYRALRILRLVKKIDEQVLVDAYCLGLRHSTIQTAAHQLTMLHLIADKDSYANIMNETIPKTFVHMVLQNQSCDVCRRDIIAMLEHELALGSIEWQKDFADRGVRYPETIRMHITMFDLMLDRLQPEMYAAAIFVVNRKISDVLPSMDKVVESLGVILGKLNDTKTGKQCPEQDLVGVALMVLLFEALQEQLDVSSVLDVPTAERDAMIALVTNYLLGSESCVYEQFEKKSKTIAGVAYSFLREYQNQ